MTAFEWRLLSALMLRRNTVVSRAALAEWAYEYGSDVDFKSIEVVLGRIRRKIGGNHTNYINYTIAPTTPGSGNYLGAPLNHSPHWTFSAGYTQTLPLGNAGNLIAIMRTCYRTQDCILNNVTNAAGFRDGRYR